MLILGGFTMALHVMDEANRCLGCKIPQCQKGCPIKTPIPEVIRLVNYSHHFRSWGLLISSIIAQVLVVSYMMSISVLVRPVPCLPFVFILYLFLISSISFFVDIDGCIDISIIYCTTYRTCYRSYI